MLRLCITATAAVLLLGFSPGNVDAQTCPGSCVAELADPETARVVENYAKALLKERETCVKKGITGCPCPSSKSTKISAAISGACATKVACHVGELLKNVLGQAWDGTNDCYAGVSPTRCELKAVKQAGKLVGKRLGRGRTGQTDKNAQDARQCFKSVAKECGEESAHGVNCIAAVDAYNQLVIPDECREQDAASVEAAVDAALASLSADGVGVSPEELRDPMIFVEMISRSGSTLGCHFKFAVDGAATSVALSRTHGDCEEPIWYCGNGSSCHPTPGGIMKNVSPCMNSVCEVHDQCYGDLSQQCVNTGGCGFTQQTMSCDDPFFGDADLCIQNEDACKDACGLLDSSCRNDCDDLYCNAQCHLVRRIAQGAALGSPNECAPGGDLDCPDGQCVSGCCVERDECGNCDAPTSIAFGQTKSGTLTSNDCDNTFVPQRKVDRYRFTVAPQRFFAIDVNSTNFDTTVRVTENGLHRSENDNCAGSAGSDSCLYDEWSNNAGTRTFDIEVSSAAENALGAYSVRLREGPVCYYEATPTGYDFGTIVGPTGSAAHAFSFKSQTGCTFMGGSVFISPSPYGCSDCSGIPFGFSINPGESVNFQTYCATFQGSTPPGTYPGQIEIRDSAPIAPSPRGSVFIPLSCRIQ